MSFSQRDIVFVHFPFTDLSQSKLRSALIISAEAVNHTSDFICLQITSKEYADGMYFPLQNDSLNIPLKLKSGISLPKVFTVNKSQIVNKISSLKPGAFHLVESNFKKLVF